MNERIRELAKQAGLNMWINGTDEVEFSENEEKFAELIVRECGQWFNDRLATVPDYGMAHRIQRNQAVVSVMKEYNEHFRVEE